MQPVIRIIRPSSLEKQQNLLSERIEDLRQRGAQVLYKPPKLHQDWPFTAGSDVDRARDLMEALTETESTILLCARGGYGASDLLGMLNWETIRRSPAKLLVGFSDASALHSAFWTLLKRPSLHGPMPGSELWERGPSSDIAVLWDIISGRKREHSIEAKPLNTGKAQIGGWLFGGCFSVLTELIGTPYFPKLEGAILFFEDITETPPRLMRMLNQWILSKSLEGVRAIVLGEFVNCCKTADLNDAQIYRPFAARTGLPTFRTRDIGHISPNQPMMIGSHAEISSGTLTWRMEKGQV